MGEYYDWVNVDKKEYITPNDFDYGNKSIESCSRGNEFLCALRELLHNEWAGDHIFFMGDEKNIPEDTKNETLKLMYNRTVEFGYPGCPFDTEMEYFKNVGGLFKEAEKEVRPQGCTSCSAVQQALISSRNHQKTLESQRFQGFFMPGNL